MTFDPGETKNLVDSEATTVGGMKAALEIERQVASGTMATAQDAEMDEATMDQLRALGYMGEEE